MLSSATRDLLCSRWQGFEDSARKSTEFCCTHPGLRCLSCPGLCCLADLVDKKAAVQGTLMHILSQSRRYVYQHGSETRHARHGCQREAVKAGPGVDTRQLLAPSGLAHPASQG